MSQNFDATCTEQKSGSHCDELAKWKAVSLTHVEYMKGILVKCMFSTCPYLFIKKKKEGKTTTVPVELQTQKLPVSRTLQIGRLYWHEISCQ